MKILIFTSIFAFLISFNFPKVALADDSIEEYMNDFYHKSNQASLILKELETNLKDGSRKRVCSRQREAARLGLLANKSLIKAFKVVGTKPPIEAVKASQKRWESILNEC